MSSHPHPPPEVTLVHLSDLHLLAGGALLFDRVDTEAHLRDAAARIVAGVPDADAIVVSGDVADLGEPEAYALAREILQPAAAALGVPLIWAAGNHDERPQMRAGLDLPGAPGDPIDSVTELGDLRLVVLDSSVPGWHHGAFDDGQADALVQALADPPPLGSILVMHHPPIRYRRNLMQLLEFRDHAQLAEIIADSQVRAVLSGHLHVSSSGTCGGVPVVVAAATSYADDLGVPGPGIYQIDATQSFNLVQIYPDQVTHSIAAAWPSAGLLAEGSAFTEQLMALDPATRADRFSRKPAR